MIVYLLCYIVCVYPLVDDSMNSLVITKENICCTLIMLAVLSGEGTDCLRKFHLLSDLITLIMVVVAWVLKGASS